MRGALLAILALVGVLGIASSSAQPAKPTVPLGPSLKIATELRPVLHSLPVSATICITGLADGSLDIAVTPKGKAP